MAQKMTIDELRLFQALPLDVKIMKSQQRIREWVNYYGEDGVYISFSGGKDSTVLLDLVRGLYPNIEAVFSDTGLEFPEIREFVKTIDNVTWIKPDLTFRKVIEKCGYPIIGKEQAKWIGEMQRKITPQAFRKNMLGVQLDGSKTKYKVSERWMYMIDAPFKIGSGCCTEMKKKPLHKFAKESGKVPFIGTMAEESMLRTQQWLRTGCNAFDNHHAVSMPMAFWTEADVWAYIKQEGLRYSSIYDKGYARTGCIFCLFGCHLESEPTRFQQLQKTHPTLWRYCLKDWEKGGLGMREVLEFYGIPYENYSIKE